MGYKKESQVLEALGIESFRNITKDKVIQLFSMMPDVDKDLQIKLVEQIPQLKDIVIANMDALKDAYHQALASNDSSQQQVADALQETRAIFNSELGKDLSPEQRESIYLILMELAKMQIAKDSENKEFIEALFLNVAKVTFVVIGATFAFWAGTRTGSDGGLNRLPKSTS